MSIPLRAWPPIALCILGLVAWATGHRNLSDASYLGAIGIVGVLYLQGLMAARAKRRTQAQIRALRPPPIAQQRRPAAAGARAAAPRVEVA